MAFALSCSLLGVPIRGSIMAWSTAPICLPRSMPTTASRILYIYLIPRRELPLPR